MEQPTEREAVFTCCYCNQLVPRSELATFTLNYEDVEQYWFGHAGCFILALQPHYRILRPEWETALGYLADWPVSPGPSASEPGHSSTPADWEDLDDDETHYGH
jgi:hypothetical protein